MPNALAQAKSPYLLQHADNPVAWLPWGEEAFTKARAEQKPIFLSIGYATCHWCHVMAHESFENTDVAAVLNASFVPIKVDREERPDVDRVYMTYVQAMTGHGGWPLNTWLTPDLKPFYGGTYFPPEDRGGRAGFVSLLRAIAHGWATERERLVGEGERVIAALREHLGGDAGTGAASDERPLAEAAASAFDRCFQHFYESFDPDHGGFGGAPKFPRASNLNFLLRAAVLQGLDSEAGREAVNLAAATCRAMVQGGIHDHVGGGFHRYAVDAGWLVPHFEKMLYDQAQMALNLLEVKQATGDERFAWAARDVLEYVRRDLADPDGGFHSAEDADSEVAAVDGGGGRHRAEGAFYVWTQAEIEAAVGPEAALVCRHFGVRPEGNVPAELDPHHELTGRNILAQVQPLASTAQQHDLHIEAADERLRGALDRLRAARARRPRPLRDDKIITAWNGLMISALARAHQVLGSGDGHLAAAVGAAEFIERALYDPARAVLFRSWRHGRGESEGFAEDYAFLIQGLLDLYGADFDERWLRWAERLQTAMDERFWDEDRGGYFNSQAGDPSLVLRLKEDYDGAEPAPSSVAASNLFRLGALLDAGTGSRHAERGRRCLRAFESRWTQTPHALPQMLCAIEWALSEPVHVVLVGSRADPAFGALAAVVHERLRPALSLAVMDPAGGGGWLASCAPWMAGMAAGARGDPRAYVCRDFACQAPVSTPEELRRSLAPGA
jgi:uncharacterized protein YyaL (SSP411 family)